jgi:hypothetical protein
MIYLLGDLVAGGGNTLWLHWESIYVLKEFLGFWTLSIVRCLKEHDISETGSVSVLR